jgi:NAD(P)-dependent dehydrogenase (short-subunit alcohol dehydrogenase family)
MSTVKNTAVVTGAGHGLGRAIAGKLAGAGYAVLATDIDEAAAAATAAALGADAWSMAHDVRDAATHRQVAAAAVARGRLAVWVNNAGVLTAGRAWEQSEEEVRRQMEVNVNGVIWGCRAAVEHMDARGGHIINVASLGALVPGPGVAVYAASKHAVLGFTTSLQGDLSAVRSPIRVSALCPDAIRTDMVHRVASDPNADLLFSGPRLFDADEVAGQVLKLLRRPRLVLVLPRRRAALAHAFRPFPALGLKVLSGYRRLGARHRRRATGPG